MATVGSIIVNLLAGTAGFQSGMRAAQGTLQGFAGQVSGVAAQIAGVVGLAGGIGSIGMGIKLAADAEQAATAMGVLLGSADEAKQLLEDLTGFAATTPFELPELQSATKQLLAFKVSQDEVLSTLRMLGDVSSGLSIPLNDLVYVYGTVRSQGRAMTQDLNQFAARGIPIWDELSTQFGVTNAQMRKLVEQGKVGFPEIEAAFKNMTKAGGQFYGMTEQQAKTFTGRLSTMRDAIGTVFRGVGESLIEELGLKDVLDNLSKDMDKLKDSVKSTVGDAIYFFRNWSREMVVVSSGVVAFAIAWRTVAGVVWLFNQRLKIGAMLMAAMQGMTGNLRQLAISLAAAAAAIYGMRMYLENLDAQQPDNTSADIANAQAAIEAADAAAQAPPNDAAPVAAAALDAVDPVKATAKILESIRTPYHDYLMQMADMHDLVKSGHLSVRDYNLAVDELDRTLDRATGGARESIRELEDQIGYFGDAEGLQRYKLAQAGANEADIDRLITLQRQLKVLEDAAKYEQQRADEIRRQAEQITQSVRSPLDVFRNEIARLRELGAERAIDQQTMELGMLQARDQLASAVMGSIPSAPGAALRGTADAVSAINQSRREDRQLHTLEQILEVSREQVRLLNDRARANAAELAAVEL